MVSTASAVPHAIQSSPEDASPKSYHVLALKIVREALLSFDERQWILGDGFRSLSEALALELQARPGALAYLDGNRPAIRGGLSPWNLRKCREYMERRGEESISLAELAALIGLSRYYFLRAFKRSTGLTPGAYHRRLKLVRAEKMLLEAHFSICQISLSLGYESQQAFARMFRRETGLSPREYQHLVLQHPGRDKLEPMMGHVQAEHLA